MKSSPLFQNHHQIIKLHTAISVIISAVVPTKALRAVLRARA
uniref:Uncharacterized protein n=1 Tax=Anguilla anguilla TaxID=7936 RepID=A0A0E9XI93_ANGAN